MRGCPATGRMSHNYDKETHRCKGCGRWQAGFKPKVEPVRPRAECQICECEQAIDRYGHMVHHGYKRPGCGYIQGDCYGVGHKPYPATDALEAYLKAVRAYIEGQEARLVVLPTLETYTYRYHVGYGSRRQEKTREMKRGDQGGFEFNEGQHHFPSFDDLIAREARQVEMNIRHAREDEKRVLARIENAQKS